MIGRAVLIYFAGLSWFVSPAFAEAPEGGECFHQLMELVKKYSPGPATPLRPEEINYQIFGKSNKETVVLIHGLGGSGATWADVAEDLASKYRVVVYDQRGHGATALRGKNYSSDLLADDLKTLLDHLKIEKAHILGHSMGGRTAVRFAGKYPENTASVIIEDMHVLGRRTPLPDNLELSDALEKAPKSFVEPLEALKVYGKIVGKENVMDFVMGRLQPDPSGMWVMKGRPEAAMLYSTQGLQEDLTEALKRVKSPALFIAADPEKGAVLFGKGIDHIRAVKPDAQIHVVPGAGHGIHGEKPDEFLSVVRNFIKSRR